MEKTDDAHSQTKDYPSHWSFCYWVYHCGDDMSSILYSMINARAEVTYDGPEITASNYGYWVKHWFHTAEVIRSEFINERLFMTAAAINDIAIEQRKICNNYLGE
jgi:hypothetical protein